MRGTGNHTTVAPPIYIAHGWCESLAADHLQRARCDENSAQLAQDDVFVLDGYNRSLPIYEFFDVVQNDSNPDLDPLEVIEVTQPLYGTAGIFSRHTIFYQLGQARTSDSFSYTVIDVSFLVTINTDIIRSSFVFAGTCIQIIGSNQFVGGTLVHLGKSGIHCSGDPDEAGNHSPSTFQMGKRPQGSCRKNRGKIQ